MASLDGSASEVVLAPGVVLRAPGLIGTADVRPPGPTLVRGGPQLATVGFAEALERASLTPRHVVEVEAGPAPGATSTLRSRGGRPGMELQVPGPEPGHGHVLLLTDEHDVMSWHFPQLRAGGADSARGGAPITDRFVVPSDRARDDGQAGPDRSLVSVLGKKLLTVLVYPLAEQLIGRAARALAAHWEKNNRPERLRTFRPGEQIAPPAAPFTAADLSALSGDPALLFLHGVFSTANGSFGALSDDTLQHLNNAYAGRVFAFDHPTLSADPVQNADALRSLLAGHDLTLDIVCHSRGGLVARALAGELGPKPGPSVRRVVFVGTPNAGTAIVATDHIVDLLDRLTSFLNLVPPGPWSVIVDVLDGVLEVVKVVGQGAVDGLPGLACMANTPSPLIAALNAPGKVPTDYYAIDADYQPTGGLALLCRAGNLAVDIVFGEAANDVAVPSAGVGTVAGDNMFPVRGDRLHRYPGDAGVWHCSYFQEPTTGAKLVEWLT